MVQAIIQRLQIELAIGELVPFQNHAGLRGWIQTGRPYPTFHGIHKPSTCTDNCSRGKRALRGAATARDFRVAALP